MQRRPVMRRLALTLLAWTAFATLSACTNGYGGSSLGNDSNQPDHIVFKNGSGANVSFFEVAPDAITPLAVTALGTRGGADVLQSQAAFTWSVRYGTASDAYQLVNNTTGLISFPACPTVAARANAPASVLTGTTGSTTGVLPSALAAPAASAPVGSGTAAAPVYCLVLTATANNGRSAPVTVLVSN
ncbi:MAG: hypothetical protein ACREML_14135 [Vulcanimicrobiaceae bacterium]